ncbi:hypothetical protein [Marinilabilia salmonicolor]|uniref:hypothetical protein n=1 Tax=Marinilabilia salmonicolor TaxID=989 RepID=UPI00029B26DD|nr:hypothetical protein [Marinilabilia salmonicolor]
MKKTAFILMLTLLFDPVFSQTEFSVPTLPDSARYQRMVGQANFILLSEINYAKQMGQTVEEVATHVGNLFKTTWPAEKEFKGFVQGCLYNFYCYSPIGEVKILEQSDVHVVFETTNLFSWLKENGSVFDVTYEEYITYLRIMHEQIADYMNSKVSFEENNKGLIVTLKKKTS